jgi:chemotaxis protein MotB
MRLHQHIRREQGRHADDWLITYADTITLLLCLFVIILSIKTGGTNLTRDAVAAVPRATAPEDIFWGGHPPFGGLSRARDVPEVTINAQETNAPAPPRANPVEPPAGERPLLVRPAMPAVVDRLQSQGTAVVEQHGDRITTLQISSAAFFASGSAALSAAGQTILRDVAVTLKSPEFAGYRIAIEGHTDDMPINTVQFQSNWELSTARAASVVRCLLDQGIEARKLTAAGYADTFPVAPNRTADGTVIPENQARNRRVVIKLEKIDKS